MKVEGRKLFYFQISKYRQSENDGMGRNAFQVCIPGAHSYELRKSYQGMWTTTK